MWTAIICRDREPDPDKQFIELECDRAYITFCNLVLLKTKLGYKGCDGTRYRATCEEFYSIRCDGMQII